MFSIVKDRKIKIAIIGCGRISKNHFGSIEKHQDEIELVAVCDTNPEVLKAHKDKYKVEAYSKLELLLEEAEFDLACICTPSGIHPEQTIACANAGINVMTEKPMATRWQDGVNMVKACDKAGVRLW